VSNESNKTKVKLQLSQDLFTKPNSLILEKKTVLEFQFRSSSDQNNVPVKWIVDMRSACANLIASYPDGLHASGEVTLN
jgi:hypothetical protein